MADTIRIGLIGAGGNTRRKHIPFFRALDGVSLHGVVNRSRASSEAVAEAFGIPQVYGSWEELIADPDVDAVCIGTWPYMHCPMMDITTPEDSWIGWRVEEEFIGAIRGKEPIRFTTFADGVRYMEFTEAVALSHAHGKRVTLPLEDEEIASG